MLTNIRLRDGSTTSFVDSWLYSVSDPAADRRAGTNRESHPTAPGFSKEFWQTCKAPPASAPRPPSEIPLDIYCDDCQAADRGRIDYIFVEAPQATHTFNLDHTRVRRRSFRRSNDNILKQPGVS